MKYVMEALDTFVQDDYCIQMRVFTMLNELSVIRIYKFYIWTLAMSIIERLIVLPVFFILKMSVLGMAEYCCADQWNKMS